MPKASRRLTFFFQKESCSPGVGAQPHSSADAAAVASVDFPFT